MPLPKKGESVRITDVFNGAKRTRIGFVIGSNVTEFTLQLYKFGKAPVPKNMPPALVLTNETIDLPLDATYWPVVVLSLSDVWMNNTVRYMIDSIDVYSIICASNDVDYVPTAFRKTRLDSRGIANTVDTLWLELRLECQTPTVALDIYFERLRFYDKVQSSLRSGKGVGSNLLTTMENSSGNFISWFYRFIEDQTMPSLNVYSVHNTTSSSIAIEANEYIDRSQNKDKEYRLNTLMSLRVLQSMIGKDGITAMAAHVKADGSAVRGRECYRLLDCNEGVATAFRFSYYYMSRKFVYSGRAAASMIAIAGPILGLALSGLTLLDPLPIAGSVVLIKHETFWVVAIVARNHAATKTMNNKRPGYDGAAAAGPCFKQSKVSVLEGGAVHHFTCVRSEPVGEPAAEPAAVIKRKASSSTTKQQRLAKGVHAVNYAVVRRTTPSTLDYKPQFDINSDAVEVWQSHRAAVDSTTFYLMPVDTVINAPTVLPMSRLVNRNSTRSVFLYAPIEVAAAGILNQLILNNWSTVNDLRIKMNEYVDSWISSANWLTEGNLGQVARAVQLWCIQDHRVATNDLVIEDYVHRLKIASNKPLTKNEKKKFLYWFFDQLCDDVA